MKEIQLIILAGGKGTRMNSEHPKVLVLLKEKPLIKHLLDHASKLPSLADPIIVIGYKSAEVKKALGPSYTYVLQIEQKGTGHAVLSAKDVAQNRAKHILVLYGDHPFVDEKVMLSITKLHMQNANPLTMATIKIDDFSDWRHVFNRYGRIIRNSDNTINRIVEYNDASEAERAITEVNPSFFCFQSEWLWDKLSKLHSHNTQHEIYLTDLVEMATREGNQINSISINPKKALGANTPEELQILENMLEE